MGSFVKPAFRTLVGAGLLLVGQAALACGNNCPPTGKIGDFVWEDCNGNGIQDDADLCEGGAGIEELTVKLVNTDGGDCATGPWMRTTTTDDSGRYLFDGLPSADYRVCFPRPEKAPECPDGTKPEYTIKDV